ncbi:hypothetical protein B484DRAFT_415054, partial [Ochromonadaceae sp. CCMP2298]
MTNPDTNPDEYGDDANDGGDGGDDRGEGDDGGDDEYQDDATSVQPTEPTYIDPNAVSSAIANITKGISLSMVEGQGDTALTTAGLSVSIVRARASLVSTLAPPQTAAEIAYGSAQASEAELVDSGGCDSGSGYVSFSTLDAAYFVSFAFNQPQNLSQDLLGDRFTTSNLTFPKCTQYEGEGGGYVECNNCSLSSYDNFKVTYACFDIINLCGGGGNRERRLQTDDGGLEGEQTDATSINYAALLDTFVSVLGQNPFAINFEEAKIVIGVVIALFGVIVLGYVFFTRWGGGDRLGFVYLRDKKESSGGGSGKVG